MRRIALGLALAASLPLLPSAAHAAVVGASFNGLEYSANAGESNDVTVGGGGDGKVDFIEATGHGGLTTGQKCAAYSASPPSVECSADDQPQVAISLGDGADRATDTLSSLPALIDGGAGTDVIFGGGGNDQLGGGPGNDETHGGAGNDLMTDAVTFSFGHPGISGDGADTMFGDAGDDTFIAGPGADLMDGGSGQEIVGDTVDYSAYTVPVHVSVDAGGADDGKAGEGDEVKNMERVLGGAAGDTLVASAAATALAGGPGNDVLTGGAGNDRLLGGDLAGDAGSGDDTLDGGLGADELRGGDGIDTVTYASRTKGVTVSPDDVADDGEPGEKDNVRSDIESFIGGKGDDTFKLRDGRTETVACGDGADTVTGDAYDTVAADCEHVDLGGSGSGPAPTPTPTATASATPVASVVPVATPTPTPVAAALTLPKDKLKPDRRRRIALTLTCSRGAAGCAGTVTVKLAAKTLGKPTYALAPGGRLTLRFTLSAAQRKRGGKLTLTAKPVIGTAAKPATLTISKG